jgi:hypothetical protein
MSREQKTFYRDTARGGDGDSIADAIRESAASARNA